MPNDPKLKLDPAQLARMANAMSQVFGASSAAAKKAFTDAADAASLTEMDKIRAQLDAVNAEIARRNAVKAYDDLIKGNAKLIPDVQALADQMLKLGNLGTGTFKAPLTIDIGVKDFNFTSDLNGFADAIRNIDVQIAKATGVPRATLPPDTVDWDADQPPPESDDITMDDFLDGLSKGPATTKSFTVDYGKPTGANVNSGGGRKRRKAPEPPEGYYAIPGGGSTFDARGHLKQLGGYWDAEAYCWYMPVEKKADATRALNEATIAASLHQNNPDAVQELLRRNVPLRGMARPVEAVLCWECGGKLYGDVMDSHAGPAHFRQTRFNAEPPRSTGQLHAGAVLEERYCGCVERGDKPAAQGRPNFRKQHTSRW